MTHGGAQNDRLFQVACSGESTGCGRCKAIHKACIYAEPGKRGGRRKTAHGRLSASDAAEQSSSTSRQVDERSTGPSLSCRPSPGHVYDHADGETALDQESGPRTDSTAVEMDDFTIGGVLQVSNLTSKEGIEGPASDDRGENDAAILEDDQVPYEEGLGLGQWVHSDDGEDFFRDMGEFLVSQEPAEPSSSSLNLEGCNDPRHSPGNPLPQSTLLHLGISEDGSTAHTLASPHQLEHHVSLGVPSSDSTECSQPRECRCLQPVVFLLEDLEPGDKLRQGVDVGLAALKEALGCAEEFLSCIQCRAKSGYMTVLSFLVEKLTTLCENIAAEYWTCVNAWESAVGKERDSLDHPILLGHYEADSVCEWVSMMEALLKLQLRNLYSLMDRMEGTSATLHLESVREKVALAQKRVAVLLRR